MQYHDYIAAHNARREREQQLLNKYDQKPVEQRVKNLWLHQVDRQVNYKVTAGNIIYISAGLLMVGIILLLSIWL